MAHTLYSSEQAATAALEALRYLSVLPRTVRMDYSTEFVAGRGQTVNVLAPISAGEAKVYTKAKRTAREAIEFNDLAQTWVPVTLEDQIYNAVRLPDDFATFTLRDLTREVLVPQAQSVVDGLAAPLITEMNAITADAEAAVTVEADGSSNVLRGLIRMNQVLNDRKVPRAGRTLAVGTDWEAALLSLPQLQKVNEAGDGGSMLRQAQIGNLFGFNIIVAPELASDKAVAYHRDAFAFVTRPTRVPEGAPHGAVVSQDGFALRHIMQYNPIQLEDQSIVDAFFGSTTLDANRAVAATIADAA